MISTNHRILMPSERSRHATQQKKVTNPKYASYSVAHAHEFPVNEAFQMGTCRLVRIVITTMNTNMKPKRILRKIFILTASLIPSFAGAGGLNACGHPMRRRQAYYRRMHESHGSHEIKFSVG